MRAALHSLLGHIATEAKALNLRQLSGELRTFDYGRLWPDIHNGHRDAFAERNLWNVARGPPGSVRLYAGELDHLGPLLGFF